MKNKTQPTNNNILRSHPDPVLEVEGWKDKVYEQTKDMTHEELMEYYREGLELVRSARQMSQNNAAKSL